MAIELSESFQVDAPIQRVWTFMLDPENVAACMPGAALTEVVDERNFVGNVKVKIGAITAKYAGTIAYTTADEAARTLVMLVEATEKGGGTVSGTITTRLTEVSRGLTGVQCESAIDMTGRIVQVGRGMIEGVARQIIGKFVVNVKTVLEPDPAEAQNPQASEPASLAAVQIQQEWIDPAATSRPLEPLSRLSDKDEAINIFAVAWKIIRDSIKGFFRRVSGRHN